MSIPLSALATWLAINVAIVAALYFKPFGARLRRWLDPARLLSRGPDGIGSEKLGSSLPPARRLWAWSKVSLLLNIRPGERDPLRRPESAVAPAPDIAPVSDPRMVAVV